MIDLDKIIKLLESPTDDDLRIGLELFSTYYDNDLEAHFRVLNVFYMPGTFNLKSNDQRSRLFLQWAMERYKNPGYYIIRKYIERYENIQG